MRNFIQTFRLKNLNFQVGFTLIELIVAVAILGGLAAATIPAFTNFSTKGRDTQRQSDLKKIQVSLEQYFVDENFYPLTISTDQPITSPSGSKIYLDKVPKDPKSGDSYAYEVEPSGCNNGSANPIVFCTNYCLYANLEVSGSASKATGCNNSSYNFALRPTLGGSGSSETSGATDYTRVSPSPTLTFTPTPRPTSTPTPTTTPPTVCSDATFTWTDSYYGTDSNGRSVCISNPPTTGTINCCTPDTHCLVAWSTNSCGSQYRLECRRTCP